ncbi:MAG: hypothetical protein N2247_11345 [Leptospiraceae bacterium]|nr:hypothetical protein [Leptospiraceae bacterium]
MKQLVQKLKNFENMFVLFLGLIIFLISTMSIIKLIYNPIPDITQKIISYTLFIYLMIFSLFGLASLFIPSKEKKLKKLFSLCLMSLFVFFPFVLIIEFWVSLVIYLISTIGIVLFLKYR